MLLCLIRDSCVVLLITTFCNVTSSVVALPENSICVTVNLLILCIILTIKVLPLTSVLFNFQSFVLHSRSALSAGMASP